MSAASQMSAAASGGGAGGGSMAQRAQAAFQQQQQQQAQKGPQRVSGMPSLDGATVPLTAARAAERQQLFGLLEAAGAVRSGCALVLDTGLAGPLGLVVGVQALREHGVARMFHFAPSAFSFVAPPASEVPALVFLVRPKVAYMKALAAQIRSIIKADEERGGAASGDNRRHICVYFVPRRTMICRRVLEEEGVFGKITVGEFALDLIPFEKDVLSLELPMAFRECFLENDRTSLFYVARSLMKMQRLFGVIPRVVGLGRCANRVVDMILRMRKERGATGEEELGQVTPEIDNLIIIDRECDMVTPLCTQLTYEGLIDEVFGINNGAVDLPAEVATGKKTAPDADPQKPVRVALNNDDRVFAMVRDQNFAVVGPKLNARAKEIDQYYRTRHNADLTQLREFVSQFGSQQAEHQHLVTHTNMFEQILQHTKTPSFRAHLEAEQNLLAGADVAGASEYLEDCIGRKEPFSRVLRLLCMLSLCAGGLKPAVLEFWKREILQTYGYEHLFTLDNLQKLGFLSVSGSGGGIFSRSRSDDSSSLGAGGGGASFPHMRKNLNLILEDVDESNPKDVAYVYSGYAPVSIRMIEAALAAPTAYFAPSSQTVHEDDVEADVEIHGRRPLVNPPAWARFLPGAAVVEELQPLPPGVSPRNTTSGLEAHRYTGRDTSPSSQVDGANVMSPVTMVFFIGGMTFTEIAALRWLSQHRSNTVGDVLIATTKLINGDSLLDTLLE